MLRATLCLAILQRLKPRLAAVAAVAAVAAAVASQSRFAG